MKPRFVTASILGLALATSFSANAANIFAPGDPIIGGAISGGDFVVGTVGTAAGVNNWPSAEAPAAVINGAGQKYLNFAEFNTGFIVTPTFNGGNGSVASAMTLWTANDAEPRDPASYEVYGTNVTIAGAGPFPLSDFTLISSGGLSLPSTRNAGGAAALDAANSQTVTFTNANSYTSYMVIFPTVKDSASANSMQIAEVQLDGVVPEPASAGLAALGAVALLFRRRR